MTNDRIYLWSIDLQHAEQKDKHLLDVKPSGSGSRVAQQLPHLGVPTHSTFLYPSAATASSRNWELRSVNRYWALLFLLSRGHSSTLGLLSWAAVTAVDLCEEWASCSPGRSRIWQSWQNLFSSSGREANLMSLWIKFHKFHKFLFKEGGIWLQLFNPGKSLVAVHGHDTEREGYLL